MKGEQEMKRIRCQGPKQVGEIQNGTEDLLSVIEVEIHITIDSEDKRRRDIGRTMCG